MYIKFYLTLITERLTIDDGLNQQGTAFTNLVSGGFFSPSSVSSASTPGGPGEDVMKSMEFHWESLGMIGEGVMKSLWIIGILLDLRI